MELKKLSVQELTEIVRNAKEAEKELETRKLELVGNLHNAWMSLIDAGFSCEELDEIKKSDLTNTGILTPFYKIQDETCSVEPTIVIRQKKYKQRPIIIKLKDTHELVGEFNSIKDAADFLGVDNSQLRKNTIEWKPIYSKYLETMVYGEWKDNPVTIFKDETISSDIQKTIENIHQCESGKYKKYPNYKKKNRKVSCEGEVTGNFGIFKNMEDAAKSVGFCKQSGYDAANGDQQYVRRYINKEHVTVNWVD